MTETRLRAVTRTQGNNQALKAGTVSPRNFALRFEEVPVLVDGFRRMVRDLEFDVCEMALTTYLCAKAHGTRFTALPIFLVRGFHHGAILHNTRLGISHPKDLEGRQVGVNRGYTVTTGVWARSILQDEYGVDLNQITWVLSGDEHVASYRPPDNVVPVEPGGDLAEMISTGRLAATVGVKVAHPDVAPLIEDPTEAGFAALRDRGLYPINHLVVVRDELLEQHPGLAGEVFEAFADAKRGYVERLRRGDIVNPSPTDAMYARVMEEVGGDPLPYGIDANREVLEGLIGHTLSQKILDEAPSVDSLFAKSTHGLNA